METFRGKAHMPGADEEWNLELDLDWDKKEVNVRIAGAPGHITSWPGLLVHTFDKYEVAFRTKGIPPLLTHWWHLARDKEGNLWGLIVGLPNVEGKWTTCPVVLDKVL